MAKQSQIVLGALAPSIAKQLKKQGRTFDAENIKFCQKIADAISLLHFKGYIGDRVSDTARSKLIREIDKSVHAA